MSPTGSLAERVLRVCKHDGILIAGVRMIFRTVEPERLDAAILGLVTRRQARIVSGMLIPLRRGMVKKCRKCGDLAALNLLLDTFVCLPCASAAAAADPGDSRKSCPCCRQAVLVREYGHGVYCKPCQRGKARMYRDRKIARRTEAEARV